MVVYFLKGVALPHIRLLYLASLVLIVAKAIRHHKQCNIQGFWSRVRLMWYAGKIMSCDFHYVCVTPAHRMSPWTQRGRWLIPKGLFVIHRKLFGNLSIASFWRGDITIDEEVLLFIIERKVAEMGFRKHRHHVRTPCRISCLPFFHLLWNIWKYRNQIIGREKGVPSVLKFLSLPRWGSVS